MGCRTAAAATQEPSERPRVTLQGSPVVGLEGPAPLRAVARAVHRGRRAHARRLGARPRCGRKAERGGEAAAARRRGGRGRRGRRIAGGRRQVDAARITRLSLACLTGGSLHG